MVKVFRTSTIAISLDFLLSGQLNYLSNSFEVTAVSGHDKHLDVVKSREKVKTISVEMQRNISPLKDLKSLVLLYKLFKKEQPQIVHSITPKAGLLSMLAAKFASVPIRIHTFTGLIFPTKTGMLQTLLIQMDRILCWAATNIIPEGNGVKKDLESFKITSKPLHVIANGNVNGINVSHFNPEIYDTQQKQDLRKELKIEQEDFVYVFIGRLVEDKGINELITAFKEVNHTHSATKLLLVGFLETELNPLEPETLKEIEENPNIIFVGFQKDVRPYLAISSALVFPSYREGFPNVVMQAGAMGLPSIVSNINGCNEIIIEGKNGTIIPVKDIDATAEAMRKFYLDKEYYSALKQNARAMIVNRYEQQVVWDALLEEYNRLLIEKGFNLVN